MKKIFALIFAVVFIFTGQALACEGAQCSESNFWKDAPKWTVFLNFFEIIGSPADYYTCPGTECSDFGVTESSSNFNKDLISVTTGTKSSFSGDFLGSGFVRGGSYAGGQANIEYNTVSFTLPPGTTDIDNKSTQNFAQALGGFDYSIATGDKLYCLVNLPTAKATGSTKGGVAQTSTDTSGLSGPTWATNSTSTQQSAAGFESTKSDSLSGINKTAAGEFTGDSTVNGITYANSYKGQDGNVQFVGTSSGANNSASTVLTGDPGSKHASGTGSTIGSSDINIPNNISSTTSGKYAGKFCYEENGYGNADGSSVSNYRMLDYGAVVGTRTTIAVNDVPK